MRGTDQEREHESSRIHPTGESSRRTSSSSERRSGVREEPTATESSTIQTTLSNASSTLDDTHNRLQQIRDALSFLEASLARTDRTRARPSGDENRSPTRVSSGSNADANMRPPHSAILLSEENNTDALDTAPLLESLNEVRSELPEYMHATANMLESVNRSRGGGRQSDGPAEPSRDLELTPPYRSRASDALNARSLEVAPGRYVRPNRGNGSARESLLRPSGSSENSTGRHALPAWRTRYRQDDGSSATTLGLRVDAARRAGSSDSSPVLQRPLGLLPSRRVRPAVDTTPSIVIPRRSASRVVVPPGLPDRVSRRIAQFETTANESRHRGDSDGSETEVDNRSNYVYRPARVRQRLDTGFRTEHIHTPRFLSDNYGSSPTLPEIERISPLSSPGGIYSTGQSSPESSPQQDPDDRSPRVSSRLQNVFGHLNRLSSVLSDTSNSAGPSTDGDDLNGALFSRQRGEGQERVNEFHEIVDEEEGRTYRIRRRINADGLEHVHQINADDWWDDDNYMEPFFPSSSITNVRDARSLTVRDDDQRLFTVVQTATNEDNTPSLEEFVTQRAERRAQRSETDLPSLISSVFSTGPNVPRVSGRGWARLDANGDEIPTDEEEEYERQRTAQRLRNLQSTRRWANSPSTVRTRLEYLAPTRSVFSHPTSDEEPDVEVRISPEARSPLSPLRMSNMRFTSIRPDVRKEKEKEAESEQVFFGTSEPYYVYPLPMRVEDMRPYPTRPPSSKTNYSGTRSVSTESQRKAFAGC